MTTKTSLSRYQAAGIHLGLSALMALVVVALMVVMWYPPPLFTAMGGRTLLLLIVSCDVVIGPLITLLIYRWDKPGVKTDLAIIALVQIGALTYGVVTMYQARPAFVVFAVDRFEVVAASDIDDEELAKGARPAFRSRPVTGPRVVGVLMSTDPEEQLRITMQAMNGGGDIKTLPRLYVPYEDIADRAASRARPLSDLVRTNSSKQGEVDMLTKAYGVDAGYLPLSAREKSMAVILDRPTGRIREIADLNPW